MSVHQIKGVDARTWNLVSFHLHNSWKEEEDILRIIQIYNVQEWPCSNNSMKNWVAWFDCSSDNHKKHSINSALERIGQQWSKKHVKGKWTMGVADEDSCMDKVYRSPVKTIHQENVVLNTRERLTGNDGRNIQPLFIPI